MKLSKNRVTAIWAEHESTRAIGYKNRLPWKKCQLDLDIFGEETEKDSAEDKKK